MKDRELEFDRNCHVLYSKKCKEEIKKMIAYHYSSDKQEEIWERVQRQFVSYLKNYRTDLGGKKNFHNGLCGTYDCIAFVSYYVTCKDVSSLKEIEEAMDSMLLPSFRFLGHFVDCNKIFFKKLLYKAFLKAKKPCDKWNDYVMNIAPFDKDKPIYYEFTKCPVAEFAKENDVLEIMPAFCNPDYKAMELIGAKLIRTTTCSNGCKCDYTICGCKDFYINDHPEYYDEACYRRNK